MASCAAGKKRAVETGNITCFVFVWLDFIINDTEKNHESSEDAKISIHFEVRSFLLQNLTRPPDSTVEKFCKSSEMPGVEKNRKQEETCFPGGKKSYDRNLSPWEI